MGGGRNSTRGSFLRTAMHGIVVMVGTKQDNRHGGKMAIVIPVVGKTRTCLSGTTTAASAAGPNADAALPLPLCSLSLLLRARRPPIPPFSFIVFPRAFSQPARLSVCFVRLACTYLIVAFLFSSGGGRVFFPSVSNFPRICGLILTRFLCCVLCR